MPLIQQIIMEQKDKKDYDKTTSFADMSHLSAHKTSKRTTQSTESISKKEKRALILGSFLYILPRIGIVVVGFLITMLLIQAWLS